MESTRGQLIMVVLAAKMNRGERKPLLDDADFSYETSPLADNGRPVFPFYPILDEEKFSD